MITVGAKVRSHGALYINASFGYRKVHTGTVVALRTVHHMGRQELAYVATRYGSTWVNPSQLARI